MPVLLLLVVVLVRVQLPLVAHQRLLGMLAQLLALVPVLQPELVAEEVQPVVQERLEPVPALLVVLPRYRLLHPDSFVRLLLLVPAPVVEVAEPVLPLQVLVEVAVVLVPPRVLLPRRHLLGSLVRLLDPLRPAVVPLLLHRQLGIRCLVVVRLLVAPLVEAVAVVPVLLAQVEHRLDRIPVQLVVVPVALVQVRRLQPLPGPNSRHRLRILGNRRRLFGLLRVRISAVEAVEQHIRLLVVVGRILLLRLLHRRRLGPDQHTRCRPHHRRKGRL